MNLTYLIFMILGLLLSLWAQAESKVRTANGDASRMVTTLLAWIPQFTSNHVSDSRT